MTLNQSALLELTDVLRTADGGKVMHGRHHQGCPARCGHHVPLRRPARHREWRRSHLARSRAG